MDFTVIEIDNINAYLRFWLGGIDEGVITDETLNYIIQMQIDAHPEYTGCDVTYYSAVAVLQWLMRKQEQGSTASGEIKSLKEKVGQVEVTTTYDVGDSMGSVGWEGILDDLLGNPTSIGCAITPSATDSKTGSVLIGGVSQKEYDRVRCNPDSKSGYDLRSPFRGCSNPRNFRY